MQDFPVRQDRLRHSRPWQPDRMWDSIHSPVKSCRLACKVENCVRLSCPVFLFDLFVAGRVRNIHDSRLPAVFSIELTWFPFFAWWLFGCVIFSIVLARLIDFPILRMREKFFSPEQAALASPPAGSTSQALVPAKNA